MSSSSVFVWHDGHCRPLQRPYDGPFCVLEKKPKYFIIDKNGSSYSVSVDRLKPAISTELPQVELTVLNPVKNPSPGPLSPTLENFPPLPPPAVTRSGRTSRPTNRFIP